METIKKEGLSRRTIMKGAAWSVPVIAAAVAVPMAAASTSAPNGVADYYLDLSGDAEPTTLVNDGWNNLGGYSLQFAYRGALAPSATWGLSFQLSSTNAFKIKDLRQTVANGWTATPLNADGDGFASLWKLDRVAPSTGGAPFNALFQFLKPGSTTITTQMTGTSGPAPLPSWSSAADTATDTIVV